MVRPIPPVSDRTAEFERLLEHSPAAEQYVLRLYVTGNTPRSTQAIANIRAVCEERLAGRFQLEVVDIYQQPGVAVDRQIIAAPTLVKELPEPVRRLVGDLSNRQKVLVALNLQSLDGGSQSQWLQL